MGKTITPLVSIIVPNYNHAPYLKQRMDSIIHQSFQDFEIILLDDRSTDESVEVLKQYADHPKVSYFIINEQNSGSPFKQWKKGLRLAQGKYVWIAETDDWADLHFLELLLPFVTKKNIALAFSNSNWTDKAGEIGKSLSIYKMNFERSGEEEIRRELLRRCTIQNVSAVLWKKSVLDSCSDDFVHYRACGDWMLYAEALLKGDVAYLSQALNNFRWYHDNISNKAESSGRWIREGVHVLEVVGKRISLPLYERAQVTYFWLKKARKLAVQHKDKKAARKVFGIALRFLFAPTSDDL